MLFDVIDRACLPRHPTSSNADRVVVTDGVAAVVDGTTAKPWHQGCLDGESVAQVIASTLEALDGLEDVDEVVERLSVRVAAAKRSTGCQPGEGGAATVAVLLARRRLVVRVGDPWVRVGAVVHGPELRAERQVAGARALLAAHAVAMGATVEELRGRDVAREGVLPLLRAADELRNHTTSPWAFAAFDGGPVPPRLVECWSLPEGEVEITLATDGYPVLAADLAGTEQLLADRLAHDPLLVEEPPSTKGSPEDGASFDDRSFVRLRLRAALGG